MVEPLVNNTNVDGTPSLLSATDATWRTTTIPILKNQIAYASDLNLFKIGDGVTLYSALPYLINEVSTQTQAGIIRIATPTEVATGTDNTTAITPAALAQFHASSNGINLTAASTYLPLQTAMNIGGNITLTEQIATAVIKQDLLQAATNNSATNTLTFSQVVGVGNFRILFYNGYGSFSINGYTTATNGSSADAWGVGWAPIAAITDDTATITETGTTYEGNLYFAEIMNGSNVQVYSGAATVSGGVLTTPAISVAPGDLVLIDFMIAGGTGTAIWAPVTENMTFLNSTGPNSITGSTNTPYQDGYFVVQPQVTSGSYTASIGFSGVTGATMYGVSIAVISPETGAATIPVINVNGGGTPLEYGGEPIKTPTVLGEGFAFTDGTLSVPALESVIDTGGTTYAIGTTINLDGGLVFTPGTTAGVPGTLTGQDLIPAGTTGQILGAPTIAGGTPELFDVGLGLTLNGSILQSNFPGMVVTDGALSITNPISMEFTGTGGTLSEQIIPASVIQSQQAQAGGAAGAINNLTLTATPTPNNVLLLYASVSGTTPTSPIGFTSLGNDWYYRVVIPGDGTTWNCGSAATNAALFAIMLEVTDIGAVGSIYSGTGTVTDTAGTYLSSSIITTQNYLYFYCFTRTSGAAWSVNAGTEVPSGVTLLQNLNGVQVTDEYDLLFSEVATSTSTQIGFTNAIDAGAANLVFVGVPFNTASLKAVLTIPGASTEISSSGTPVGTITQFDIPTLLGTVSGSVFEFSDTAIVNNTASITSLSTEVTTITDAISSAFYTETIADLRALTTTTTSATNCNVAAYATPGDSGGGTFIVAPADTTTGAVITGSITPVSTPVTPTLASVAGGSAATTTYYVKITYNTAAGQTLPSSEASLTVAANSLLVVDSPAGVPGALSWNVGVSTTTGTETLQATNIAIGTNWTESTTGLIAGGALPTTSTAGSILSATAVSGTITVGFTLVGISIANGTYIVAETGGTGGIGSYLINGIQTIASETMTSDNGGTIIVDLSGRRWYRQYTGPVNVIWFGATGNGTTDDSAPINSAVTAAGVGRSVYIPHTPAGYAIGSPIDLPSGISLCGDNFKGGQLSRIFPMSGYTGPLVTSVGYGSSRIQQSGLDGLYFDGSATTDTAVALNCQECVVRNCTFSNMWTYAIHFGGINSTLLALNNVIEDCYFTNVPSSGTFYDAILEDYYSADTKMYNNYIQGCTNAGIHTRGSNIIITGNHLYDCAYGVYSEDADERIVVANYMEHFTNAAIYISSGSSTDLTLIANISNNEFRNVNIGGTALAVVELHGSYLNDSIIANNIVKRDGGTAYTVGYIVYSDTGSSNVSVHGNTAMTGIITTGETNIPYNVTVETLSGDIATINTTISSLTTEINTNATAISTLEAETYGYQDKVILENYSGLNTTFTGAMTSGSSTLTLTAVGDFVDLQGITVEGAGASGADLTTQVTAGAGSTTLTLATAASTTVSAAVVHHDDSVSIQTALTSGASNGKPVILPPSTPQISQALTLSPNQIFAGSGRGITTLEWYKYSSTGAYASAAYFLSAIDCYNVRLADFSIRGPGFKGASGGGINFALSANSNCENINILNVDVSQMPANCFNLSTLIISRLDNCKAEEFGGTGFQLNNATSVTFNGCYALSAYYGAGFDLSYCSYVTLSGTGADNCAVSYDLQHNKCISFYAPGSEGPSYASAAYPGIHLRSNSDVGVTVSSPYFSDFAYNPALSGANIYMVLTNGASLVVTNLFAQDTAYPCSATYTLDATSSLILINPNIQGTNTTSSVVATGGILYSYGTPDFGVTGSTPASGATIQIPDYIDTYYVRGSAALASLTIELPNNPAMTKKLSIIFQIAITSFTLTAPAGVTINVPVTGQAIAQGDHLDTNLDGTLWC